MDLEYTEAEFPVVDLRLDLRNPRMPEQEFLTEEDAIAHLASIFHRGPAGRDSSAVAVVGC